MTFTADLPDELAVGDYVALAGETPIVNAPVEAQDLLLARATYVYLLARGDAKAMAAREYLADVEARALPLIKPRTEGNEEVILNFHGVGWNRAFRGRKRLP
jgi:hypothetical protein